MWFHTERGRASLVQRDSQGKTQPRTAAVYDHPYAWDARAAYVIGTRHRDDYRLFVPRELAPDLAALTGQIVRRREDKGASLRFDVASSLRTHSGLASDTADQKLGASLQKGRETLIAAQAERERQAEEVRKAQDLRNTLTPKLRPKYTPPISIPAPIECKLCAICGKICGRAPGHRLDRDQKSQQLKMSALIAKVYIRFVIFFQFF